MRATDDDGGRKGKTRRAAGDLSATMPTIGLRDQSSSHIDPDELIWALQQQDDKIHDLGTRIDRLRNTLDEAIEHGRRDRHLRDE
jgi:hypothetical protein